MKWRQGLAGGLLGLSLMSRMSLVWAQDEPKLYQEAVTALSKGSYVKAADTFTSLKENGIESFELNYNLGLANQKLRRVGPARAAYERARQLHPWDRDTIRNLEKLKSSLQDSEPEGSSVRDLAYWFSETTLLVLFTLSHAVLLAAGWKFLKGRQEKHLWLAVSAAVVCIVSLTLFGVRRTLPQLAAVVPESTILKNGPGREFTDSLALHAGVLVEVLRKEGDWTEVVALGNVRAWLPESDLAWVEPKPPIQHQ